MKKRFAQGYTLAEALITLAIIAMLASVFLPLVSAFKPDTTKIKWIQTYDAIVYVSAELVNNQTLFPSIKDVGGTMYDVSSAPFVGSGQRFCEKFNEALNAIGTPSCTTTDNYETTTSSFNIRNGSHWKTTTATKLTAEDKYFLSTIDVYFNGDPNDESEHFKFAVTENGKVRIGDAKGIGYNLTRALWRKSLIPQGISEPNIQAKQLSASEVTEIILAEVVIPEPPKNNAQPNEAPAVNNNQGSGDNDEGDSAGDNATTNNNDTSTNVSAMTGTNQNQTTNNNNTNNTTNTNTNSTPTQQETSKSEEQAAATSPSGIGNSVNILNISDFASIPEDCIIYIYDEAGLRKLSSMVRDGHDTAKKKFQVANDISLTQTFEPIGYYDSTNDIYQFKGSFNGAGYTISNLRVNTTQKYAGLFGSISAATIRNLNIKNASVQSSNIVIGVLAGRAISNSVIEQCNIEGDIITSSHIIGGVVGGITSNSVVKNCNYTGSLKGTDEIGGIAGNVTASAIVKNCTVSVTITGSNHHKGGIVGYVNSGKVLNCAATGSITGGAKNGGIVGSDIGNSIIKNCCNNLTMTDNATGSIIAHSQTSTTVINCYATTSYPIYGHGSSPKITNSFNSSANLTSASTFSSWVNELNDEGEKLWNIVNGKMPTLNI